MSNEPVEISVVMPCLNEAETIGHCIRSSLQALEEAGATGEVVVADNGSTDSSRDIARSLAACVVEVQERGYGSALRGGIAASRGTYFLIADADGSYDFRHLVQFFNKLREGHDLVVGTRLPWAGGTLEPGAMPWLHRHIGTPAISLIGRMLFGSRLTDFNCGMRAMRRAAYDRLHLRTTGMEFASEMIVKASMFGLRIAEVPIRFGPAGRTRPPHLRTFRDGWRHLRYLLMCNPHSLFVLPGLALMLLGMSGTAALLIGPLRLAGVIFDTNTFLVFAIMLPVGFQTASFGMIARIFAMQSGTEPARQGFLRLVKFFSVEFCIALGALIGALGFALLTLGLAQWGEVGFGRLSYPDSLRIVIPAVILMMLGVQVLFSGFVFHIVSRTHL